MLNIILYHSPYLSVPTESLMNSKYHFTPSHTQTITLMNDKYHIVQQSLSERSRRQKVILMTDKYPLKS